MSEIDVGELPLKQGCLRVALSSLAVWKSPPTFLTFHQQHLPLQASGQEGLIAMAEPAYKRWYKTARWQKLRARFLYHNPLCVMCSAEGRTTVATICDHKERHGGDEAKFWTGPFQSLCKPHHDSDKQRIEKGGKAKAVIGVDGWPEE